MKTPAQTAAKMEREKKICESVPAAYSNRFYVARVGDMVHLSFLQECPMTMTLHNVGSVVMTRDNFEQLLIYGGNEAGFHTYDVSDETKLGDV